MKRAEGLVVRPYRDSDLASVTAIYAHHVRTGTGTFEESAPAADEMARRLADLAERGLPVLVASEADATIGYAYAAPFRLRTAYRWTVEDSVYVAPTAVGRGVGGALVGELLDACTAIGLRQMLALVGDSENEASIRLHASLGFRQVGRLEAVGLKFGRWLDVVVLQRELSSGGTQGPSAAT